MNTKVLKWLVLVALMLLIVSFFSFWFGGPSFRDRDVSFELLGPTQASVGEEVVYKIKYRNNTKLPLYNLSIAFYYPDDSVVIKEGNIQRDLSEDFEIEELESGEEGEKEFKAFVVGNKGDIKNAKADLSFKAGDLRSSFEKKATLGTTITSVPVSLSIATPPNVVPGQTIDYIFDYRNESDNPINDLLFEFTFPEGFTVRESTPNPNSGNNKWRVDSLKKNGAGRISVRGVLTGKEGDIKNIHVSLKRKINDQYVDFQKASSFSVVSNPLLSLDISVNNSRNYVANPGDELSYSINYKNTSSYSLSNLILSVKLDGNMYDLSTLDTRGGFFDGSTRTIVWGPSNISDFSSLGSNINGTVGFAVKLKQDFNLQGSDTLFVKSSAKLSTSTVPDGLDASEIASSVNLVTNITKLPTISQSVDSVDDKSYNIKWNIANPGNGLNNAIMKAALSEGVSWQNIFSSNISLENPTYNEKTKTITWNLGNIPGGVGALMPKYELQFQVLSDINSNLLKDVELSGSDSVTGQNIIVQLND